MDTLWQDLRFASRLLRRNPGFTVVAVITLALGIGANTAIFNLVNGILLRPLPVASPEQIVALAVMNSERSSLGPVSYPNFEDLRDRNDVLGGLAVHRFAPLNLTSAAAMSTSGVISYRAITSISWVSKPPWAAPFHLKKIVHLAPIRWWC